MDIVCKDLCFSYDGNVVLSNVSIEVNHGDYVCVIGENGAGKSTFLKGLLGLKKADSGSIVFGDDVKMSGIGYLPQLPLLHKMFPASCFEVVLTGCLGRKKGVFYTKAEKKEALEKMELLGVLEFKDKQFVKLSGGQKQRVLLARALLATKRMLFLDEPVTGLDPKIASELYDLIDVLNHEQGITVVMVSHDVKGALERCSHVLEFKDGSYSFETKDDYCRRSL